MKYAIKQLLLIILCSTAALNLRAQSTFRIFDKPIVFDEERKQLSLEYLEKRHGLKQTEPTIKPIMVVLHWTVIPSIEQTFNAFNKSKLPGARKEIATASALNVSSQFLIDRDGTIFRLLPDTVFARHVIGLNYCAIGVENIGSDKNPLTPAQLAANEQLIRYLKSKYPIEYVIGHYEYTLFKNTSLWKEADPAYSTHKTDPGVDFMKKLREQIKDLNIKGAPAYN
ncbi:peptidoglycan recognition family protein [Pedobacter sp. ASV1-7]|uniref:N-acetylmuramoyl-L-alanine amidase n=1 Tax=Pedobacter sp. ASV1-7 TaxID=3145237 RepID=UPI0032E9246A